MYNYQLNFLSLKKYILSITIAINVYYDTSFKNLIVNILLDLQNGYNNYFI